MIYLDADAGADGRWQVRPTTELDATADKCFMDFRMRIDPGTGRMVPDYEAIRAGRDPHAGPDYAEIGRRLGLDLDERGRERDQPQQQEVLPL